MVLTIPANFQLPPESTSPVGQQSCSAGGQWADTHRRAWPLMGCWAGNGMPGPHLHTLKPPLVWLIWDTVLGGVVPLGSPSDVLCRMRPLVNRQSYRVRTSRLETFQVSELKAGVIWGNFSWLINPRSHLGKTVHLTTDLICCFPTNVVFTPGLSANESDFHHHLYLTCKLYPVGTTVNDLKWDA